MCSERRAPALLLALALGACGSSDPLVDLGPRDASGGDGSLADLSTDLDSDGGEGPDLPIARDAGPEPSPSCFDDRGVFDHCLCEGVETCVPGECGAAALCLPDLCGRMTCQPAGAVCFTAGDCGAGSTCTPSSLGGSVCQATSGCGDARDCPVGFACEAGACADRRRPCAAIDGCPVGFLCESNEPLGAFCRRAYRLCANDAVCPRQSECVDLVGDGEPICRRSGGDCDSSLDCDENEVCGTDPRSERAVCGPGGPCSTAEGCPAGSECLDLYGDGVGECAVVGACRSAADCASLELCGAPATGGPTACR